MTPTTTYRPHAPTSSRSRRPRIRFGLPLVAAGLALVCVSVLPLAGTAAAAAATASTTPTTTDPAKVGLFGAQDPTFDGVYRQSLSLLALVAAGRTPAPKAVAWLLAQQCADGGFEAFRTRLSAACTAPDSVTFSGEDTNSTGIAAQALHALGHGTEAGRAVDWLASKQGADGGWAYFPDGAAGNDPDANSTALSLSAFLAVGRNAPHAGGPGGPTPFDALEALQVGCEGAVADRGAFTFFGSPNDFATVQATLAVAGGSLPVPAQAGADDSPVMTCPAATPAPAKTAAKASAPEKGSPTSSQQPSSTVGLSPAASADAAAGYLVRELAANGHAIPDPFNAGQIDYGTTANAVLALVATKHGSSEVTGALGVLAAHVNAFVVKSGADQPGALALLVLSAVAGGQDPATFGGSNLLDRLSSTVTVAATVPASPTPTPTHTRSVAPAAGNSDADDALPDTGFDARAAYAGLLGAVLLLTGVVLVVYGRRGARQA